MSKDKTKASWDIKSTKVFIDLCLEQIQKGRRKGGSFHKDGWKEMAAEFTIKTGRVYNKVQLKNKYDALRKDWQLWDRLLHETGVGWDNEKNTIIADDDWWEKKLAEVPGYEKFKNKGLQFQELLTQMFSSVAATGQYQWAPSSMTPPTYGMPEDDLEEGSGDSDEVLGSPTGLSGDFVGVTLTNNSGGSGLNSDKGKRSSGGDKSSGGCRTTSSLGVRRKGDSMKKKVTSSVRIADALSRIATTQEVGEGNARDDRITAEREQGRAYESSIAGVMNHLVQIEEVRGDSDFYSRCMHLVMHNAAAREMYVALKHMREDLLLFLRSECYGHN